MTKTSQSGCFVDCVIPDFKMLPHFGKIEITIIFFEMKDDSNQAFCHVRECNTMVFTFVAFFKIKIVKNRVMNEH